METLFDDEDLDYVESVSTSSSSTKDPKSEWVEYGSQEVIDIINQNTDGRVKAGGTIGGDEVGSREVFIFLNEEQDVGEHPSIDKSDHFWWISCDGEAEKVLDLFRNGGRSETAKTLNDTWNTRP